MILNWYWYYKWEFVYLMEKMELKELKKKTKQWVEYYTNCSQQSHIIKDTKNSSGMFA